MANPNNNSPKKSFLSSPMALWIFTFLAIILFYSTFKGDLLQQEAKKLSYDEFISELNNNNIASVEIEKNGEAISGEFKSTGRPTNEPRKFTTVAHSQSIKDLEKELLSHNVTISYRQPGILREILPYAIYILIYLVILYLLFYRQFRSKGGGILSFVKNKAVRVTKDKNAKTFADVAGIDEAKDEVMEIVEFLKNPNKFKRLGGRLPKGVLLVGTPGNGKTLLAKAIAGEANVPFFSISGSDFVEMFVGVGASRVRDLFKTAKESSPCIIFLDEIDAVGRKRSSDLPSGGGAEDAQTLNAILVEMDGFQTDDSVIVIAATNREDVLDPALLRPGRFDRKVYVDLPDVKGREEILRVHIKNVKVADNIDLSIIARATPSFSGADLENLVNEAAILAAMHEKEAVDMASFEEARDKVRFGKERKSRVMDDDDRRSTAYHEAGHALLMYLLPDATPLHKVTIIPRGRAYLGAAMKLPAKDQYHTTKKQIISEIIVALGGRASEEIFLNDITTGASMDLKQATAYAQAMVCEWGMSDEVGLSYVNIDKRSYLEAQNYSDDTARKVDEEVKNILDKCYKEAKDTLKGHRESIEIIVQALMEYEVLSRDEIDLILKEKSVDPLKATRKSVVKQNQNNEDKNKENEKKLEEQIIDTTATVLET